MKKFIKMSLVAAVAVAGLSSSVNAKTIADVAEDVNVFGYVQIRYDDYGQGTDNSSTYTHKAVIGATGKINDDLSYMFAGTAFAPENTSGATAYSSTLLVYNYFTYTGIKDTSISIGKQGLDTPLTTVYDPADATSEGTGVSLTSKLGPVTINAARFASTTFNAVAGRYSKPGTAIDGGESYSHLGLSANVGPVALDAWYADMTDRYDTWTVGASAKLKAGDVAISPYARYASADIDNIDADQSIAQAGVTVKSGIVGGSVAYGSSDKEGGWVTFDKDTKANIQGWNVSLLGNADADLTKANLNVDVLSNVNVAVNYTNLDRAAGSNDVDEVYAQIKYQMSSNFSAVLKMGTVEEDNTEDKDVGRVDLLWLF